MAAAGYPGPAGTDRALDTGLSDHRSEVASCCASGRVTPSDASERPKIGRFTISPVDVSASIDDSEAASQPDSVSLRSERPDPTVAVETEELSHFLQSMHSEIRRMFDRLKGMLSPLITAPPAQLIDRSASSTPPIGLPSPATQTAPYAQGAGQDAGSNSGSTAAASAGGVSSTPAFGYQPGPTQGSASSTSSKPPLAPGLIIGQVSPRTHTSGAELGLSSDAAFNSLPPSSTGSPSPGPAVAAGVPPQGPLASCTNDEVVRQWGALGQPIWEATKRNQQLSLQNDQLKRLVQSKKKELQELQAAVAEADRAAALASTAAAPVAAAICGSSQGCSGAAAMASAHAAPLGAAPPTDAIAAAVLLASATGCSNSNGSAVPGVLPGTTHGSVSLDGLPVANGAAATAAPAAAAPLASASAASSLSVPTPAAQPPGMPQDMVNTPTFGGGLLAGGLAANAAVTAAAAAAGAAYARAAAAAATAAAAPAGSVEQQQATAEAKKAAAEAAAAAAAAAAKAPPDGAAIMGPAQGVLHMPMATLPPPRVVAVPGGCGNVVTVAGPGDAASQAQSQAHQASRWPTGAAMSVSPAQQALYLQQHGLVQQQPPLLQQPVALAPPEWQASELGLAAEQAATAAPVHSPSGSSETVVQVPDAPLARGHVSQGTVASVQQIPLAVSVAGNAQMGPVAPVHAVAPLAANGAALPAFQQSVTAATAAAAAVVAGVSPFAQPGVVGTFSPGMNALATQSGAVAPAPAPGPILGAPQVPASSGVAAPPSSTSPPAQQGVAGSLSAMPVTAGVAPMAVQPGAPAIAVPTAGGPTMAAPLAAAQAPAPVPSPRMPTSVQHQQPAPQPPPQPQTQQSQPPPQLPPQPQTQPSQPQPQQPPQLQTQQPQPAQPQPLQPQQSQLQPQSVPQPQPPLQAQLQAPVAAAVASAAAAVAPTTTGSSYTQPAGVGTETPAPCYATPSAASVSAGSHATAASAAFHPPGPCSFSSSAISAAGTGAALAPCGASGGTSGGPAAGTGGPTIPGHAGIPNSVPAVWLGASFQSQNTSPQQPSQSVAAVPTLVSGSSVSHAGATAAPTMIPPPVVAAAPMGGVPGQLPTAAGGICNSDATAAAAAAAADASLQRSLSSPQPQAAAPLAAPQAVAPPSVAPAAVVAAVSATAGADAAAQAAAAMPEQATEADAQWQAQSVLQSPAHSLTQSQAQSQRCTKTEVETARILTEEEMAAEVQKKEKAEQQQRHAELLNRALLHNAEAMKPTAKDADVAAQRPAKSHHTAVVQRYGSHGDTHLLSRSESTPLLTETQHRHHENNGCSPDVAGFGTPSSYGDWRRFEHQKQVQQQHRKQGSPGT